MRMLLGCPEPVACTHRIKCVPLISVCAINKIHAISFYYHCHEAAHSLRVFHSVVFFYSTPSILRLYFLFFLFFAADKCPFHWIDLHNNSSDCMSHDGFYDQLFFRRVYSLWDKIYYIMPLLRLRFSFLSYKNEHWTRFLLVSRLIYSLPFSIVAKGKRFLSTRMPKYFRTNIIQWEHYIRFTRLTCIKTNAS